MSNLERRIEDNMSIIADLKSSWDPSVGRCFVDVFLNRQLKVQVSESRLLLLMAQRELVSRPVRSLLSSEVTNRELALPRAKPGQQFDGPVCRRDGHNFSHTAVVFAVHGQVPSFSRCKKNQQKTTSWSDHLVSLKSALVRLHVDQVQEELTRVVGSRQVRVEDRKDLPFTDAVIHESQRLCNIVPMAIPHRTSRDVTFQGYFIKEVNQNAQRCDVGYKLQMKS